ncbi:MAG: FAD-binding protein [Oscillospiraceae bacterium]|nr:FAD-binding protein [Oscillospiraceae bacterium]
MLPIEKEIYTCDVLVAGGGMAGLMAAIAAAGGGASVIVAEKAHTLRSGDGVGGNDHFLCYIPEVHGSPEDYLKEFKQSQSGKFSDTSIQKVFVERSFEIVQDWLKWGIDMKPHGDWTFLGHAFPGRMRIHLKYDGKKQKAILTGEAKTRGVRFENKTPITEFLTDESGQIIGAIGISVAEEQPKIKLFRAKSVISATGSVNRLYPGVTPAVMCNVPGCPANTGLGMTAAYRAGASIVNIEMAGASAGPKYFSRAGKGTWIGVLRTGDGKSVGPFVTQPTKELGDITSDVWPTVFTDKARDGSGPVYIDCSGISQEDYEYMLWAFTCEGDTSLVEAMERQGIDLRKHMPEFGGYGATQLDRGVQIDEHAATDVPGLYAAGDEVGNFSGHMAGAATMGRIAGESASAYVKDRALSTVSLEDHPVVQARAAFYSALMERESGSTWKELNQAVQQIMDDYAGINNMRSQTMLSAGYRYLTDLRRRAEAEVSCANAHELMRALESFELLEAGRLICVAAMERKETRANHKRSDFTFTNPLYDNMFVVVKKTEAGPRAHWRKAT